MNSHLLDDESLRDKAVARFNREFPQKFNKGMREHNADGQHGLTKMTPQQLFRAIREEVHDLYSYVEALETVFLADEAAKEMTTKAKIEER